MITQILIAVIAIAVFYVLSQREAGTPPKIGNYIPFFGSIVQFGQNPLQLIRNCYRKYGDIFTIKILGKDMTFMVGPEAQAVFFNAQDSELSAREAYKFMIPVFGPGVVYDSPTEVMYEQLKFIRSSLALSQLKKSIPIIASEARKYFEEKWGESGEREMLDELNNLTILTASRCLMGEAMRKHLGQDGKRIADLYHELEVGINPISFFFPNLPLPGMKRRDKARAEIGKIFEAVIKERRQNPGASHDDIMGTLMESEYKDGTMLGDEQLAGMMVALLFAGQHTSSITATWTGLFVHNNKSVLQEVISEQKEIKEKYNGELTFDSIKACNKLENCVREVLRMYPPLIILMRKVLQDMHYTSTKKNSDGTTTTKDYVVPAGHIMAVSPGASMTLDDIFANAKSFDPSRWERGEQDKAKYSIISFGGGRHGCPGENFGIFQIKTIWSVLLETYELEFEQVPPPDYTSLVAGPKPPVIVRYKKRSTPL